MISVFHTKPPHFIIKCEVSTIFMEYEDSILLLQRHPKEGTKPTWGIPGGKLERHESPLEALLREMHEELHILAPNSKIESIDSVYIDRSDIKYKLHLFKWKLESKPDIILNPKEHTAFIWQPISEFKNLDLLAGQLEAFKLVYKSK